MKLKNSKYFKYFGLLISLNIFTFGDKKNGIK